MWLPGAPSASLSNPGALTGRQLTGLPAHCPGSWRLLREERKDLSQPSISAGNKARSQDLTEVPCLLRQPEDGAEDRARPGNRKKKMGTGRPSLLGGGNTEGKAGTSPLAPAVLLSSSQRLPGLRHPGGGRQGPPGVG